jgi:hypothetical protein
MNIKTRVAALAIRADLGIGNKQVRVHYGDTTWIWVKYPHGIVHTFTS